MVRADWSAPLVWLPKFIMHNAPANPNVIISWSKTIAELPDCPLKHEAVASFAAFCSKLGPPFESISLEVFGLNVPGDVVNGATNGFGNGSANGLPIQDQDGARFARFWAVYPRKEGEAAAWKQWLLSGPPDDVFAARITPRLHGLRRRSCRKAIPLLVTSSCPWPRTGSLKADGTRCREHPEQHRRASGLSGHARLSGRGDLHEAEGRRARTPLGGRDTVFRRGLRREPRCVGSHPRMTSRRKGPAGCDPARREQFPRWRPSFRPEDFYRDADRRLSRPWSTFTRAARRGSAR